MKLSSFCIDKFGGYSNANINKINPGFTLFYGENESGKTTLKNFFQQMLFGFAKKNSKVDTQYLPFDGTVPSGNLSFILDNENQYLLSRLGNKTNLVLPDTSIINGEPMTLLWNSITKETFRQVFCMDIQDWNGLSLMDKEEMQNRFLSSSLGLNSLIKSTKQLKNTMDNLWKKQGRSQIIHEIDKKIKTIEKEIKNQEKLISEYKQCGQDLFDLEATLTSLINQKNETNSLYNKKLLLNEMKPDWVECNRIKHQMKLIKYNFKDLPFSATSIEKARKLEDEIRTLEERKELEETNYTKFVFEKNNISIEEELIHKQNEINALVEKKNQFIEAIQDEPILVGEIELEKTDFFETLKQIDPKWNKEILQQIDIPIDQKSLVKSWKAFANEIDSGIKTLGIEIQRIKEEIDSKTIRITNLSNQTKETEILTNDEFYLTTNTIKTLQEYEAHREIISETQWKAKNTLTQNIKLPFGILLFGILLLMLGIIGANISSVSTQIKTGLIFLDAIGFFSIALFFLLKQYSFKSFQETTLKNLNEEIKDYCKSNHLIQNHYKDLLLTDLILFLQKKLNTHSENNDFLRQAELAISNLNSDIQVLNNSLSVNKEKLSTLLKNREILQKKWSIWKTDHFVQNNFSILDYDILFSLINQAQSKLKNLLKSESRLNDLSSFITLTKNHIKSLSFLVNASEKAISLNPEAISTIQSKLTETLSEKSKKLSLIENIQSYTKQIEETRFNIGIKQKQLKKLFLETETNTILKLENKTEAWISYKSLDESFNQHMNRLYGKINNDKIWDKVLQELSSVDFEENLTQLSELEKKGIQIEDDMAKTLEKKGELNQKRNSIDTITRIGNAVQERAFLKSELRNNAEKWFSNALALKVIQETKSSFEKSQQPEVIKYASSWIQTITNNRYSLMKTSESKKSNESFILFDQLTSKKTEKEWSGGLADQVYLSIRMGLIDELSKHGEMLPIFLDDILIRFDSERQLKTAELLLHISNRHQLFYFSCHPKILSLFRSIEKNSSNPTSSFYNIDKFTISQI